MSCTWRNPPIKCPENWREPFSSFAPIPPISFVGQSVSPGQQMNRNNGSARKRQPPPTTPTPKESRPNKQQATTPTTPVIDDEFLDEDVFLDEVPEDEESLILRDIEQRQGFASRLSKWVRPPLSSAYVPQSQGISESLPLTIFAHWLLGF